MGLVPNLPSVAVVVGLSDAAGGPVSPTSGPANGFASVLAETAGESAGAPAAELLALLSPNGQHGQGGGLATALEANLNEEQPEGPATDTSVAQSLVLPTAPAIDTPVTLAGTNALAASTAIDAPAAQAAADHVPEAVPASLPQQAQANQHGSAPAALATPEQSMAPELAAVETPNLGAGVPAAAGSANGSGEPRANALAVLATVPASPEAIEAVSMAGPNDPASAPASTMPPASQATGDTARPALAANAEAGTSAPLMEPANMPPGEAPPPDTPISTQDGVVRIVGNAEDTATSLEPTTDATGTDGSETSSAEVLAGGSPTRDTSSSSDQSGDQRPSPEAGATIPEGEAPVATFIQGVQPKSGASAERQAYASPIQPTAAVSQTPTELAPADAVPAVPSDVATTSDVAPAPATTASSGVPTAAVAPSTASVTATSAPTASATATPPPVISPQPTQQVVQAVIDQLLPDGGQVTVRLDPPELGEVTLRMTISAERVALEAVVERPEALTILRENQEALERLLADRGLELADVFVGLQQGQGGASQQQRSTANSNAAGEFAALLNGDEDDQQAQSQRAALRAAYNPDGSLLYRV